MRVCLQRKEKQRLNFSVELIAQGAFSGMRHEIYLMLRKKGEKMGHPAVVMSLVRLVGWKTRRV